MNILIVDDQPELKVQDALDYLKSENVKFEYVSFTYVVSALRYIRGHLSEFDLAVIDLGLPWLENDRIKPLEGLVLIEKILKNNITEDLKIPVIINSTTKIEGTNGETEEEYLNTYYLKKNPKLIIEHVEKLDGSWLFKFLQEKIPDKVEFN